MKIFKTKNIHTVPFKRGIIQTEVYLKISELRFDETGVFPSGFYYVKKDGKEEPLDAIIPTHFSWEQIKSIEEKLSKFKTSNLQKAIEKRCVEFTMMKLKMEGKENYGIDPSDWEEYIAPIEVKEEWNDELYEDIIYEENRALSTGTTTVADSTTADTATNTD